jgi:hypothetical protein
MNRGTGRPQRTTRRARECVLTLCVIAVFAAAVMPGSVEAATASAKAHTASQAFTLYAAFTQSQFVNHADDRARGEGNNPFGNYAGRYVAPPENERLFGPFATDLAFYQFNLYTNQTHKTGAGSAIVVCQYNFNENSFCDASFQMNGGTLIAEGASNFNAAKSTLVVSGGTGAYRSTVGGVEMTALGVGTQAQPVARNVPLLQTQRVAFDISVKSGVAPRTLTTYSKPGQQAFADNNDDEARGDINSPFGTHNNSAAKIANEHSNGPFPGDQLVFSLNLYTNIGVTAKTGVSVYTCNYYFGKSAFCDASFQLSGGTVIAAGTFGVNAKTFALAITGGYGKYSDAKGEIAVAPSGKSSERLVLELD